MTHRYQAAAHSLGRVRLLGAATAAFLLASGSANARDSFEEFCLTLLHNNDGESQLINAGRGLEDFGGAARFAAVVKEQRADARANGCAGLVNESDAEHLARVVVTVGAGDQYLAGPEFNASLEIGVPNYESMLIKELEYDVLAIGNHELDFGPDVYDDIVDGVLIVDDTPPVWASANLNFEGEPDLQTKVDNGVIVKSTVLSFPDTDGGTIDVGIIGATTENLPFISSPRDIVVTGVQEAIQDELTKLRRARVRTTVLTSHLQGIDEDCDLVGELRGLDIAIAGGGGQLLANEDDLLVPGDEAFDGPSTCASLGYPAIATDGFGRTRVPVVTTTGDYRYLGRLDCLLRNGRVVGCEGGPVRVAGGDNVDAVEPDPVVQSTIVDPVSDFVAALGENVIAQSDIDLDGVRGNVRSVETNLGNLIADSQLWVARELAADFGVPEADVAMANGGGIRNDSIIPAGEFTELDTFDILPFTNFVSVFPVIPSDQFKEILENAVSRLGTGSGTGRFAQIAGFDFVYDFNGTAQQIDDNGNITVAGTRVISAILDDGRVIIESGQPVAGESVTLTIVDFLARGGDQYPFGIAPFTVLGVTYQQALAEYVSATGPLGGLITEADYPEGGEGRITEIN